jgi:hypothetical protein
VVGSTGLATAVERIQVSQVPTGYRLDQNYPNPFNPSTVISFDVAKNARVALRVYNALGQLVTTLFDGVREPGSYKVNFNANFLPSGIYFYSLAADGAAIQSRKMILLK